MLELTVRITRNIFDIKPLTYTRKCQSEYDKRVWGLIKDVPSSKLQVAQRATIAHLNPMGQGQSGPKPYATFPPPQ